jgi:hypothetical protein
LVASNTIEPIAVVAAGALSGVVLIAGCACGGHAIVTRAHLGLTEAVCVRIRGNRLVLSIGAIRVVGACTVVVSAWLSRLVLVCQTNSVISALPIARGCQRGDFILGARVRMRVAACFSRTLRARGACRAIAVRCRCFWHCFILEGLVANSESLALAIRRRCVRLRFVFEVGAYPGLFAKLLVRLVCP